MFFGVIQVLFGDGGWGPGAIPPVKNEQIAYWVEPMLEDIYAVKAFNIIFLESVSLLIPHTHSS